MPNARAAAVFARHADEVAARIGARPERRREPRLGRRRVGERFLRGERLGGHDEQRRRRIERREGTREVLGIDVRHELNAQALRFARRKAQGVAREQRPEVGAADADVHDIAQRASGRADAHAAANARRDRLHPRLHRADVGHHVAAVDAHGRVRLLPQRDVQRGALLREVDLLACEKGADPALEADVARVREQGGQAVRRQALLREVDEPAIPRERQPAKAIRLRAEELRQRSPRGEARMVGEGGRCRRSTVGRHGWFARRVVRIGAA